MKVGNIYIFYQIRVLTGDFSLSLKNCVHSGDFHGKIMKSYKGLKLKSPVCQAHSGDFGPYWFFNGWWENSNLEPVKIREI